MTDQHHPEGSFRPIENPYVAGSPITNDEMFFGREQELGLIREFLTKPQPLKKVLLLKGGKRSGKTSLLKKIERGSIEEVLPVFCDFHGIASEIKTDEDLPSQIGETILRVDGFDEFRDRFSNSEGSFAEKLVRLAENCLEKIKPRKLVILFDEHESVEKLFERSTGKLTSAAFGWADKMMHLPVYFIMAGSEDFGENLAEVFSVRAETPIEIKGTLPEKAVRELIEKPVRQTLRYDDKTIKKIYRLSGGHLFYVQYICHNLVNHINIRLRRPYAEPEDLKHIVEDFGKNPPGHTQEIWRGISVRGRLILMTLAKTLKESDEDAGIDESVVFETARKLGAESGYILTPLEFNHAIPDLRKISLIHLGHNKTIRFRIDILRYWIWHNFEKFEEDIRKEIRPEPIEEKKTPPPGIDLKKWIPAISVGVILLIIVLGIVLYKPKPIPIDQSSTQTGGTGKPVVVTPPEVKIADITGFEFVVWDYDETAQKDKLYLLNSSGKKELLLKNMEEPQTNPSVSLDSHNNMWLAFQKGENDESKICVVNLRKKTVLTDKYEGKMPSISPNGKNIVFLPIRFGKEGNKYLQTMYLEDDKVSLAKPIDLPSEIQEVKYPIFLSDSQSIAFIGSKVSGRVGDDRNYDIFLYDPRSAFKEKPVDPSNKVVRQLTFSRYYSNLIASMNSFRLLYIEKATKNYLRVLNSDRESEQLEIQGIDGKFLTFSENDGIVFLENTQIVCAKLIFDEKELKIGRVTIGYKTVFESNLNKPLKIITLKGGVQ